MDKKETLAIIDILRAAYPIAFRDFTLKQAEVMVDVWQELLRHFTYDVVRRALMGLISEDTRGYMPPVGAVVERALKLIPKKEPIYKTEIIGGEEYEVRYDE